MKLLLSILAVLLFCSIYWICSWVYPDSNKNWEEWDKAHKLQMNLYAVLIFICFLFSVLDTKNWERRHIKFVLGIGLGFSISDVVDRLCFSVTEFQAEDVVMITLTIALTWIEVYTKFNIRSLLKK